MLRGTQNIRLNSLSVPRRINHMAANGGLNTERSCRETEPSYTHGDGLPAIRRRIRLPGSER